MSVFLLLSSLAFAHVDSIKQERKIAIYSQLNTIGSISYGDLISYTIIFDITIQNISDDNVDFRGGCIKAYLPSNDKLSFSSLDFHFPDTLPPGASFNRTITFLSHNKEVYEARVLKAESGAC